MPQEHRSSQLSFRASLYPPMERLLILEQMRYRKPVKIVRLFFDFYMQLRIQGRIRIIPNYPTGWFAEVLSEDKVWTIECYRGELRLIKVGDLIGYTKGGSYITGGEEDLSNNMDYRYYSQCCHYAGTQSDPILCSDFCDNSDYYESQCTCCPLIN